MRARRVEKSTLMRCWSSDQFPVLYKDPFPCIISAATRTFELFCSNIWRVSNNACGE